MRAIVVVAVAVVALLGLGWYFANSHAGGVGHPAVVTQTLQAQPQNQNQNQASAQHGAGTQPGQDGVNRPNDGLGDKSREVIEFNASGKHAVKLVAKEWQEPEFQMPSDENEVVGKYVHRQMVQPKGRSTEKRVPMNDDLLVLEGRSEDRISATR